MHKIEIPADTLRELYSTGMSTEAIARIFGCSRQTIGRRLREYKIPLRDFTKKRMESLGVKPNLEESPELLYILGAVLGDGSITYNKEKYIYSVRLYTRDVEFVNEFKKCVERIGLIARVYWDSKNGYSVIVRNKLLAEYFGSVDVDNIDSLFTCKACVASFIKGLYDAEGHFTVNIARRGNKIYKHPQIRITNENIKLLEKIRELLIEFFGIYPVINRERRRGDSVEIKGRKCKVSKNIYNLGILKVKDVVVFLKEIGSSIPRKTGVEKEWRGKEHVFSL